MLKIEQLIRMCLKINQILDRNQQVQTYESGHIIIKEFEVMLKQPCTNIKMTNVATIRYKMNNRSFEIACYRNKALNWRNGVEQNINEVLQAEQIFDNASHGTMAKKSDLNKCFPNKTKLQIIEIILNKGELQVSDKEREAQQSNILSDIVKIIVQKCVHPSTKRRFTPDTIRQAIKDIYFPIKLDQTAKKQALDCIKMLQQNYKITRALMKVKLLIDKGSMQKVQKELKELDIINYESSEQKGEMISRVYDIQPSKYRDLNQLCKKNNSVAVEVLVNAIVNTEMKGLDTEQFSALELLNPTKNQENEQQKLEQEQKQKSQKKTQERVIKCSTCGEYAIFQTAQDQRTHFKSEWHVENVKRKSKGLKQFSEEDFKIAQFNENYQ